jgi:uncharacterized protein YjbJ (UPF0337 family)
MLLKKEPEENTMDENRITGTARNVGGKVQEAAGKLTGDAKLQAQGAANQAAGDIEELYGQAKDAAADVAQSVQQGAKVADDLFRRVIEERPYTTAVAALALGWVIGGPKGAAAKLGLKRTTLIHKMQKLGISRPGLQSSENAGGPVPHAPNSL